MNQKKTIGEELYLIHLQRLGGRFDIEIDADDGESSTERKRSRSIGEELYQIHLKRFHGCEPDYDFDATEEASNVPHLIDKDEAGRDRFTKHHCGKHDDDRSTVTTKNDGKHRSEKEDKKAEKI